MKKYATAAYLVSEENHSTDEETEALVELMTFFAAHGAKKYERGIAAALSMVETLITFAELAYKTAKGDAVAPTKKALENLLDLRAALTNNKTL